MTPDSYTISEQFLDVGDGHQLYMHEWGNPKAKTPIIFLHGGPGEYCKDKHKGVFDPRRQRVIFFDQRGCGKSLPYGSLKHNTTPYLVADIEKLADHFSLESYIVTGSSWGAALALFYGLAHPKRIKALVISGVWTASRDENNWVDKGGFRNFFPEAWEKYVATVPVKFADDPSAYHFPRILGDDQQANLESGLAYDSLEGSAVSLDDRFEPEDPAEYDPTGTRIEVHYLANGCFMPDRYILNNAHKLRMPVYMVQGRYDMLCPPVTTHELHKKIPDNEVVWTLTGHKSEHESWNVVRTILLQLTI